MHQELAVVFDQLVDPRNGHDVRHPLPDLPIIALATVQCGGETCADMELYDQYKRDFLETFLDLRHGFASHDTFSRVLRLLNLAAFEQWFITFMQQFVAALSPGIIPVTPAAGRESS